MRTTVELPDDLFRRAKAHAALQGRALKDIVADGLKLLLQPPNSHPASARPRRVRLPIINAKDPARKLTPQMVAAAEKRLLAEEAAVHGRLTGH